MPAAFIGRLVQIVVKAAVQAIVGEVAGDDDEPSAAEPHPTFKDIELRRAQEASSIAADKRANASAAASAAVSAASADANKRSAITTRPPRPKSDTLPSREDATHGTRQRSDAGSTDEAGQRSTGNGALPHDGGDPPDEGG